MTDDSTTTETRDTSDFPPPTVQGRILAGLSYLGAGPFLHLTPWRRDDPYLRHQNDQALGVFLLLLSVVVVFCVAMAYLSFMLVFHRENYQGTRLEPTVMSIVRKCFLAWLVVWLAGFGAALRGSYWEIPFVWRIVARPRLLALSAAGWAFIYTAILITGLLAVHATVITRDDDRPAPVYMVYEDLDIWPRWVFALGSYRISLAARERYGPDSVVVTRLTRESLAQAIRHGQFVFVGSHGSDQGLLVEHRYLGPPEIKEMGANEHLQFVYLTGCDSGAKVAAWKDALAPAEVLTFDRLSAIVEHAFWLWLKGPDKLRSLPSEA